MGKPLVLQEADAERIEALKNRLDARTKIDVVRLALERARARCREGGARGALAEGGGDGGARKPEGLARVPALQSSPAPQRGTMSGSGGTWARSLRRFMTRCDAPFLGVFRSRVTG